jgi:hypothetical protein
MPPLYWRIGAKSCRMTRAHEPPPFVVELYDGDVLISRREFAAHDDAVVIAFDAIHNAVS